MVKTTRVVVFSEERRKKEKKISTGISMGQLGLAVVIGGVGAALYAIRPRDPVFEVLSIHVKGFKLSFNTDSLIPLAFIDVELSISIKITNPNLTPIEHKSTVMCIYYKGSLLGQAQVPAGSQGANCSEIMKVPARIDGVEVTQHLKDLVKDVRKREMDLRSVVNIKGSAWLWKWGHKFEVVVESHMKVDPIFLEVTQHLKDLVKDVRRREMDLRSVVNIKGSAWLWKWGHKFEVVVESHMKVDPIFLEVIEQENRVRLEL